MIVMFCSTVTFGQIPDVRKRLGFTERPNCSEISISK